MVELPASKMLERREILSFIWIVIEDDPRLPSTFDAYVSAAEGTGRSYEFVVVSNGGNREVLNGIVARRKARGAPLKLLTLHRHCTESEALSAVFGAASGSILVLLPPYLQVDPSCVEEMLRKIDEGYDYIGSWRFQRVDGDRGGRTSRLFNSLTRWITQVNLHDINCGMKVIRRDIVDSVPVYGDFHRFLPVLAARVGFKVTDVKVRHLEERVKAGDYHLGVYVRRLLDLLALFFIIKFTRKPLRFFGLIGSGMLAIGIVLNLILVVQRIGGKGLADRPLLLLGLLLMVVGIQLFSIGLLGELIIFSHAREFDDYRIEKIYES